MKPIKKLTRRQLPKNNERIIKGRPLSVNASSQIRYLNRIDALVKEMTSQTKKELETEFNRSHAREYFAQDITITAQAKILTKAITNKYTQVFSKKSPFIAKSMVNDMERDSDYSLNQSFRGMLNFTLDTKSISKDLAQIIQASVVENVSLITSIATEYLTGVQQAVMRSITTGNGLQDLVPYLEKHEGITRRRARNIALDQTRKVFNNVNAQRMEDIGLNEYDWLHTAGSQKPRQFHVDLNGTRHSLKNPPIIDPKTGQHGKPGDLINCHCKMIPIINFDFEDDE